MGRIRLLEIIPHIGVGGAEKQLLGLLGRMNRERFDISLCWYTPDARDLEAEFTALGIRLIRLDKFSTSLWRFFGQLRRAIREVSPDIVHTWLYSANFWGRWAAVTCGVPCIIAGDRCEVPIVSLAATVTEKLLAGRTIRLANSLAAARSLERHYGLPVERTRVIYNAVDVPAIDRAATRFDVRRELGVAESTLLVVMVGRLSTDKNYPMYLRAARRVCDVRSDAVFLAVGHGPLEPSLRQQAAELSLGDRFRFLGLRQDVPRLLAGSDVFCFASDSEGFPNAVLEAMAVGLPVVCSAFPSAVEVVTDPQVGVIVPLNDDQAMAGETLALLEDSARRERMGQAASALVRGRFSWDHLVREMESFYVASMKGRN